MQRIQAMRALAALVATLSLVSGITLDCDDVVVDGRRYNLRSLGGPHSVHWIQETPPSLSNFTFTLDICKPLKRTKHVPKKDECPSGTRVCGIEHDYNLADGSSMIKQVIPIAGEYTLHNSRSLNPHWSRLRDSASSADSDKEGIRLEVGGGKYPFDAATGTPQKAYLEFLCDPARSGHEGDDDGDHDEKRRRRSDDEPDTDKDSDKDKDKDDDNGDKHKHKHNDHDAGSSLRFISYRNEDDGQAGVLRLQWRTKYACEGQASHQPESAKGSWGLFTWFIIILFMGVASYLIFGSWLNYNRYGARGWNLLPHSDILRDVPYLLKEWLRRVVSTFSSDSRGGYSAV